MDTIDVDDSGLPDNQIVLRKDYYDNLIADNADIRRKIIQLTANYDALCNALRTTAAQLEQTRRELEKERKKNESLAELLDRRSKEAMS